MSLVANKHDRDVSERHTGVSDRDAEAGNVKDPAEVGVDPARSSLKMYGHRAQNGLILAIGDIFAIGLALFLSSGLRAWALAETFDIKWGFFIALTWLPGAFLFNLLPGWGLGAVEELKRIVSLLATVFGLLAVFLFFSQFAKDVSRLTYGLTFAFALVFIPLMRIRLKRALIAINAWGVPSVIYGAGDSGKHVLKTLQTEQGLGYMPVGIFDDDEALHNQYVRGVPVLGPTSLVNDRVPVAILAMPSLTPERLAEYIDGPLSRYSKVLIIPNLQEVPTLWVRPRDLAGVLGLEITSNLYNPVARILKRIFDLTLTFVTAPVWAPLTIVLSLFVWLSDLKNPFYSQVRLGKNGRKFRAWKLRTMVVNAEEVLEESLRNDESLRLEWELYHKLRSDPRITRIGKVLRRLSLDEIPQLLNVLAGEMSLVGPRPLPEYHSNELSDKVSLVRQRVRPGITGLWQVSGRSDLGNDGLERYDAYYVRNWSLWLDMVILVRTIRTVFKGTGAY